MNDDILPHPVGSVPDDIHLALADFVVANRLMMRYFHPAVAVTFPGDITREDYEQICEALYELSYSMGDSNELDSSATADTLIRNAKEAFGRYVHRREAISF